MTKLLVTVTFEIESNPENFPPEHQTPEAMAVFTQQQFADGDRDAGDLLSWSSVAPTVKVEVAK